MCYYLNVQFQSQRVNKCACLFTNKAWHLSRHAPLFGSRPSKAKWHTDYRHNWQLYDISGNSDLVWHYKARRPACWTMATLLLQKGAQQRCLLQHVTWKRILEFEKDIEIRVPDSAWGSIRRFVTDGKTSTLITPWGRVLLEKLTGSNLVKKFPEFYRTRRFITAFTSASQLSLFWATSIQSILPLPLPEDPSQYYLPIYDLVFQVVSFPQVSPPKPTKCIYVFCVDLRTNSDYYPIQN